MVALANQGETVLAWDRDSGRPLSPAIVWQDRRASRLCDELAEHADMLAARTGLVLDPYFSAPKMAWLRRNLTTDGVVTTTDTWLVHALCGEFVTDASTASRSLLIDLDRLEWDPRCSRCSDCLTSHSRGSSTATSASVPRPRSATRSMSAA